MGDFSGNQRGKDFRGRDLRGANFANADIRGASFANAELEGADFSGAKAGLQWRWVFGQTIIAFVLSFIFNFTSALLSGVFVAYFFRQPTIEEISIVPGVIMILFTLGVLLTLAKQGFTTKAFSVIVSLFSVAVALAVAGAVAIAVAGAVAIAVAVAGVGAGVGAVAVAGTGTSTLVVAVAGVCAIAGAITVAGAGAVTVAGIGAGGVAGRVAGGVAVLALLVGFYSAWRASKGDKKFTILHSLGLAFGTLGGTSFGGADLTDANFTRAQLESTNFANRRKRQTNFTRTNWKDARKLDKARPGESILANLKVLKLLTTGQGNNQNFSHLSLRGANLDGANLNGANLKNADLSQSRLHQADLQNANLTEVQAVGTDFTGAYLTGACLQAWNIDQAIITDIQCDFYFLSETEDVKGSRNRRPHDPNRTYDPGDAEKILTEARNVVEVLLKQCTNAKDLAQALQKITETYPEATLQKLERKDGADFLVTLTVPSETDKAQVETTLHKAYDEIRALRGEVKNLQSLRAADMKDVVTALANRPAPPVNLNQNINQNTGDNPMTTQDNQAIATGANSNINFGTQTGNTLNFGTISGNLTNSLTQLATQPQTQEIAAHLQAFQTAIEGDPHLPEPDKIDALEQVAALAEASKDPAKPENTNLTRKAMKLLKGTIESVPKATSFIEACTKLLPLISKAFGL
jgi:uncharacterized protein YjbI with pentapeptide repeats